ncbi:S8 family serine peptidase [Nakamurella sp.]|uniref:S8 family serine peptidase n=1 Tax=Nakamurella sp. TaxID=1869182 RepID=UPI003782E303
MVRTRARSSRGRRVALILTGVIVLIAAVVVIVILRRVPAAPAGSVDIPDDQPVEVVFGLTRDQAGLQAYAAGGGPVLPLPDIAARFGAGLAVRQEVSNRLGASSVTFSATGGLARWRTTLGAASALGIRWDISTVAGRRVLVPAGAPDPPADLRDAVTEVIPLSRVLPTDPASRSASASAPTAQLTDLTAAPGCAQARQAGADVVAAQGLDAVQAAGARGTGARVSVIAVTRFDPTAFEAWLQCIGHEPVAVHLLPVRDGAPDLRSAEAQTDLAALTLTLPALAAVTLVGADDTDWVGDALETALTDPAGPPQVISSSIVFCEDSVSAPARTLTEYVLAAAAAAGVGVVAATGDRGSAACTPGDTAPAVTYPASSPFVLAVGGSNGSREVWVNAQEHRAGGGGMSRAFPGRKLPDLAMLASAPDLPPMPVCPAGCTWRSYGGTSFAAPFVAGAILAVGQARSAAGLGPLRLGVGGVDRSLDPGWFDDVTRGSNDLNSVGCCAAAAGFDLASGWGVPRFDVLARSPAG